MAEVSGRLVIGIGNPDRGDDGVGGEVVRRLRGRTPAGVGVVHETGEAMAILNRLQEAGSAFLVDAAASGAAPGTVHRFDAGAGALPSGLAEVSSHGFGLAQAIALARTLRSLPPRCIVYAIEGERFSPGVPLTPAVARAAATVAEQILHELTSPAGYEVDRAMHEASLMAGIMSRIQAIAEAEGAARVVGVKVWCGALSHMSRDHFAAHFKQAAAGTIAEGAALNVTIAADPSDPRAQDVVLESVEIETKDE